MAWLEGGITDILVVDDNPGDRRFIEEAFKNSQLDPTLHKLKSRDEALNFLSQRGKHESAPEPDVILLDWNLSQTTGEEVLKAAKSDDSEIPVVVMTGSTPETSRVDSAFSQADLIIEKPTTPEGYIESIRSVFADQ